MRIMATLHFGNYHPHLLFIQFIFVVLKIYNPATANSSVWTVAERLGFTSTWNSIRNMILNNVRYPDVNSKIGNITNLLLAYSTNDCAWQGQFFATNICALTSSQSCWGTIDDFVGCSLTGKIT